MMEQLRLSVYKIVLLISCVMTFTSITISFFNQRPLIDQLTIFFFLLLLVYLRLTVEKWHNKTGIRVALLVFINCVFLPLEWFTSLGSSSSLLYYSLLSIMVTTFFIVKTWEVIIPFVTILVHVFMIHAEFNYTELFLSVPSYYNQEVNLLTNFILISISAFIIVYVATYHIKKKANEFYEQSIIDPLTGVYNRRYFIDFVESKLLEIENSHHKPLVGFIDIDKFKQINDTYGHHIGDNVLIVLSKVLCEVIGSSGIVGRFGGDEFLFYIMQATDLKEIELSSKIQSRFDEILFEAVGFKAHLSIGIAVNEFCDIEAVIKEADNHMYEKKSKFEMS